MKNLLYLVCILAIISCRDRTTSQPVVEDLKIEHSELLKVHSSKDSVIHQEKIAFNKKEEFEVNSFELCSDHPSSDTDIAQCTDWVLDAGRIAQILKET